jgi:hypothetical protein
MRIGTTGSTAACWTKIRITLVGGSAGTVTVSGGITLCSGRLTIGTNARNDISREDEKKEKNSNIGIQYKD